MTKHDQYFKDMMEFNKEILDEFKDIHDKYLLNPEKFKSEFNEKGQDVLNIIRKYENMLCGKTESGKYGKFSSNLSDKFWGLIRNKFPKIDFVGVI